MKSGRMALALALVAVLACGADSAVGPSTLSYAVATGSCAPNDGPAVALLLSASPIVSLSPTGPYVAVNVWEPLGALAGQSLSVASGASLGFGVYYKTAGINEGASEGTLTVTSVAADSTVTGIVDLTFPTSGHVSGPFTAKWIPRTFLCG